MEYSLAAILLLVIGLALIFIEVFIPSGGMLMIMSVCCIGASIWSGHAAWYATKPYLFWTFLCSSLLLIPFVVVIALYYLPRTSMGKKILLQAPELDDVTPFQKEQEHLQKLIGSKGKTVSLLKPSGMVLIDGERLDCQTEGGILSSGTDVVVIDVRELRLYVRKLDDSSPIDPVEETGENQVKYDFEVPENEQS